jgi:hypothetical protein
MVALTMLYEVKGAVNEPWFHICLVALQTIDWNFNTWMESSNLKYIQT